MTARIDNDNSHSMDAPRFHVPGSAAMMRWSSGPHAACLCTLPGNAVLVVHQQWPVVTTHSHIASDTKKQTGSVCSAAWTCLWTLLLSLCG